MEAGQQKERPPEVDRFWRDLLIEAAARAQGEQDARLIRPARLTAPAEPGGAK